MNLTVTVKQAPLGSHQMIGKKFSFDEHGFRFGRSPENDLVMPDPNLFVSSRHGMVTFENGEFLIHDQSSNGLFANNASMAIGSGQPFVLQNGTGLRAGEYLFEVAIANTVADPIPLSATVMLPVAGESQSIVPAVPAARVATDPQGPGSMPEDVALELALRLGLHGMTEEKLLQMPDAVTEAVRSCITGIMDVLSSRRQVKRQLRMDTTVIQSEHNNALKFSASAEEAIEKMFTKTGDSYLPPEAALLEAFQDITDHQIAMMAATMQVHQKVVERFDPDLLEKSLRGSGKEGGLFSSKPNLWEEYRQHYNEIASSGYPSIHDDFVKEFSAAYAEQLLKLKQERGKSVR